MACLTAIGMADVQPTIDYAEATMAHQEPEPWRVALDGPPMERPDFAGARPFMPVSDGFVGRAENPTQDLSLHRLSTGHTEILAPPAPQPGNLMGGTRPGWEGKGNEPDPLDRTFNQLALSQNPESFPGRTACKLFISFTDVNGNSWSVVGSGVMIDSETVLTAAHCLYIGAFDTTGNNTFVTVNDFIDSVKVVPATHQGSDGYGDMWGEFVLAPTAYTDSADNFAAGDFDFDIGAIAVTRAGGMLTQWLGTSWGGSCDTSLSRVYYNNSYPAADCDGGGPLHNGQDMYFWSGKFDRCRSDTQLELTTTAGCLTTTWGGMSGSGAYYFDDDNNRIVDCICSNKQNDNTSAGYAKMWQGIHDGIITDVLLDRGRGFEFDMQTLNLNQGGVRSIAATAGDIIQGLSFMSTNPTMAASGNQAWNFTVHLSENAWVTESDPVVASGSFNEVMGPMFSYWVALGNIQIPLNTPSGTYYLGVIVDDLTEDEDEPFNDATSNWDALEVTVSGVVELEALSVHSETDPILSGDPMLVVYNYRNNGGQSTSTASATFTLSTDAVLDDSDFTLGNVSLPTMGGGGWTEVQHPFQVPGDLPYGHWHLIFELHQAGDANASNNLLVSDDTVFNDSAPDNDGCFEAVTIGDGVFPFSTIDATTDGPQTPDCGWGTQIYHDVWFAYDSPTLGTLTISTCDTLGGSADFDTKLAVYRTGPCDSLELLACNDDDPNNPCGEDPAYLSTIEISVDVGQSLLIRVGSYSDWASGTGNLLVDVKPDNDDCADAFVLPGNDWTVYTTVESTTDGPVHSECGVTSQDVWYSVTAPCTGLLTVTNCNLTDYDSELVFYRGTCGDLIWMGCNDDGDGCDDGTSKVVAMVFEGEDYLVRVGGAQVGDNGVGFLWNECVHLPGDLTGDGSVDINDLLALLAVWGTSDEEGDLDGSGTVDINDLLMLLELWDP